MKKRKGKILRNKEQSAVQFTKQSIIQSILQSNDTYIYGVGIIAVLAIGVYVFFTYNKKAGQVLHDQPIKPKRCNIF